MTSPFASYPPSFATFAQRAHITSPNTLQQQLWPELLQGKDCIAVAPTNSGKTLGFLLPLIPVVQKWVGLSGIRALVLAPTRELVAQIAKEAHHFHTLFDIVVSAVYGGKQDASELITSDIVIATPGRGADLIVYQKLISLRNLKVIVLDECDKLLQMGFKKELDQIAQFVPVDAQVVLTSATMSREGDKTCRDWLRKGPEQTSRVVVNALSVALSPATSHPTGSHHETMDGNLTISPTVEQTVHVCAEHKKPRKLIRHIEKVREKEGGSRARNCGAMIIFCNKIKTVVFVCEFLKRQKMRVAALHGDMTQDKREQTLQDFKAGKHECLVATDVAGRGLHMSNLRHVVNYDFPSNLSTYVHRVGRAGRGKDLGSAMSFFTRNLQPIAKDLVAVLEACHQFIDPNLKEMIGLSPLPSVVVDDHDVGKIPDDVESLDGIEFDDVKEGEEEEECGDYAVRDVDLVGSRPIKPFCVPTRVVPSSANSAHEQVTAATANHHHNKNKRRRKV